ncbi:hypothetical protein LEMLEM_LOCUS5705, partial [Lemmus lemmus]
MKTYHRAVHTGEWTGDMDPKRLGISSMTELPPQYHEEGRSSPQVTLSQVGMGLGHLPHTKNKARSNKGHIKATTTLLEDYTEDVHSPEESEAFYTRTSGQFQKQHQRTTFHC